MRTLHPAAFVRRLTEMLEEPDCRLVWFLGAGCSISSGIPGAAALVESWLPRLKRHEQGDSADWHTWASERFEEFDPSALAKIYGRVMDELFPLPHERQQEVERLTSAKDPAIGYALLATLAAHEKFGARANILLTTNFDDMISDALYLMTRTKPLVVSHDSLAPFVRASRRRPLVVKVHGDAMLAPRNTLQETATLDTQLTERVSGLFSGCALVFLGYGGNDVSIRRLLEAASPDSFPLGIYWVGSSAPGGPVGEWIVERASSRGDVFYVKNSDFDDLFLRIANELKLPMPDGTRLNELFDRYRQQLARRQEDGGASSSQEEKDRAGRTLSILNAYELVETAKTMMKEDRERADRLYSDALAMAPDDPGIVSRVAIFRSDEVGDLAGAEPLFERAIELDPLSVVNVNNYALFLGYDVQDRSRALAAFERALAEFPDSTRVLVSFASFLSRYTNDASRASSFYRRAIDLEPENVSAITGFAMHMANVIHDYVAASELFQRAADLDAENDGVWLHYATFVGYALGDQKLAVTFFERAIANADDETDPLVRLAAFLSRRVEGESGAIAAFERAVAIPPVSAEVLATYADCLSRLGRFERADDLFARASSGGRVTGTLCAWQGAHLARLGRVSEADAQFRRAVELSPIDAGVHSAYGVFIFHKAIDLDAAEKRLRSAREMSPFDLDVVANHLQLLMIAESDASQRSDPVGDAVQVFGECAPRAECRLELAFYLLVRTGDDSWGSHVRQLLADGVRAFDWDFSPNLEWAEANGNPRLQVLSALARVASVRSASIDELFGFAEWTAWGG